MSTGLKISRSLTLPLDYVTKTGAILAKRRVGKTYTASVLAGFPSRDWRCLRLQSRSRGPQA